MNILNSSLSNCGPLSVINIYIGNAVVGKMGFVVFDNFCAVKRIYFDKPRVVIYQK